MTGRGGIAVTTRTVREGNAFYEIDEACMEKREAGCLRENEKIKGKRQEKDHGNDQKQIPVRQSW